MPTQQLLQILQFENIAPGTSQILPHNININGTPQRPDLVMCDLAGMRFNVTKTTIEAFNNTGENASPLAWLELKHSVTRELGKGFGNPFASMSPRPFIPASSDDRGPFMEANVDAAASDPQTYNVVSVSHAPGSGIYLFNLINPVPINVDRAVVTLGLNTTDPGLIAYEWVDASNLRVRTWNFGDGILLADTAFSVLVNLTFRNF
jgi:hypothetical protein